MQAKPAKITELITKGAMEMVITVIQQVRSILRSARAHSPPACSLTNKISTGQSTTAVIWRQSDGVILEKEVIFRKKQKKNMEENSSRTAPSSTDACNSIVHALMCRRQGGNWADISTYLFLQLVCLT